MMIFEQGWSLDKDGPGQRLIFYLKGCNLGCLYCGNPESIGGAPEILFHPERSPAGRDAVCPHGALSGDAVDRAACRCCADRACIEVWKHPALELAGREISAAEIVAEAENSRWLFGAQGGVTFGGGEPTLQAGELLEVLTQLQERGISTALESNASTPAYREIIGHTDHLISDFKAATPETHRRLTGVDNAGILDNLEYAAATHPDLLLRTVLIPDYTLEPAETEAIRQRLRAWNDLRLKNFGRPLRLQTLRLHHMGESKYRALARDYPLAGHPVPTAQDQQHFNAALQADGITIIKD